MSAEAPGRPWPLARLFTTGAVVGGALAVLCMVLAALALAGLTEARSVLLDRVAPALEAGQRLSVALLDQETGVRGYSLTARAEFLDPYLSGRQAQDSATEVLRELADAGSIDPLDPDLVAVAAATAAWRGDFADPTVAAAAAGLPAPDPERGRLLFDDLRAAADTLLRDLRLQQDEARAQVAAAAAGVQSTSVAIAVVLLLLLVAAAVGLRRTVLRPVSDLAAQVRAVVTGEAQQPVRGGGPREIVELGEDVEAMRQRILVELAGSRRTNRRLDEQTRELERSNRDLEQFAYVASHDLQEPLRKVSSFCQLLQRRYGGELDDRADQYIEFAVDGAQRMQQLINDLLAFSRVGRTTEGFVPVPLAELAAAAVAQLDGARAEVGGEIVLGPLPTVPGDPALLRQLLVNLIGNGLKFHRADVPPVVEVAVGRTTAGGPDGPGTVEIVVSDNGIGIDAEYVDKVFVIFQRLHARDVYPGTGIGLALAKKIAEFHGGRIGIDPGGGPGATVRVTLPTEHAAPATEESPA